MAKKDHHGGCLCGAVAFTVKQGKLRDALGCHCGQCQRTHGGPAIYSGAKLQDFYLTRDTGLKWYRSSEFARRGFCQVCGASLFWQADKADYLAIAAGMLDRGSGVKLRGHIFCADKGDYYEIKDGLPQFSAGSGGQIPAAPSAV